MKTLTIEQRKALTPEKALQILSDGNERFIKNMSVVKDHLQILSEFSDEQKPFAFILSCMDSRAPVEIIFDQGIGDLFSVRVAGNIVNNDIIASAEFAVKFIGVKLVMVLGHTNCGAMSACLNNIKDGYLKYLFEKIEPVYLKYKQEIDNDAAPKDKLAEYNVNASAMELINKSEVIKEYLKSQKIKLVSAVYHLDSGRVRIIQDFDKVSL